MGTIIEFPADAASRRPIDGARREMTGTVLSFPLFESSATPMEPAVAADRKKVLPRAAVAAGADFRTQ